MKAKARLLRIEHVTGISRAQIPYDMQVAHFLDLDTFDKMRLVVPDADAKDISAMSGKDGMLDIGYDPRTEKLSFVSFRVAA